ncbi:MAG: hypothetical protein ABIH34_04650, partial [Nanoarchaeota archaeon]
MGVTVRLMSISMVLLVIPIITAFPVPEVRDSTYYFENGQITLDQYAIIYDEQGHGYELNPPIISREDIEKRRSMIRDGESLTDGQIALRIRSDQPRPIKIGQPVVMTIDELPREEFPYLEHWKYCHGRDFPFWNGAYYDCDTVQEATQQEWDDSWTEMDPYPEFYRISRLYGAYECVQYHDPDICEGDPGVCCYAQANYDLTNRKYVDSMWNADDYEYDTYSVHAEFNTPNECGNPECIAINPDFYVLAHVYGDRVSSQSPESVDKYDYYDHMTSQNYPALMEQMFSVEEPVNENYGDIGTKVDSLSRFFWNNQETGFSDVPAILDDLLFYFDDDSQGLNEWALIQGGQFCSGSHGSHEFCEGGTSYTEWIDGFNYYLDDYTFYETVTLSDAEIMAEIDEGRPVSLRIGWDEGGGQAAVIVGYSESPLTWYIYDPINQLQAYSDV